jgi:hypothetical protein
MNFKPIIKNALQALWAKQYDQANELVSFMTIFEKRRFRDLAIQYGFDTSSVKSAYKEPTKSNVVWNRSGGIVEVKNIYDHTGKLIEKIVRKNN